MSVEAIVHHVERGNEWHVDGAQHAARNTAAGAEAIAAAVQSELRGGIGSGGIFEASYNLRQRLTELTDNWLASAGSLNCAPGDLAPNVSEAYRYADGYTPENPFLGRAVDQSVATAEHLQGIAAHQHEIRSAIDKLRDDVIKVVSDGLGTIAAAAAAAHQDATAAEGASVDAVSNAQIYLGGIRGGA